jgi:hypothetical protein
MLRSPLYSILLVLCLLLVNDANYLFCQKTGVMIVSAQSSDAPTPTITSEDSDEATTGGMIEEAASDNPSDQSSDSGTKYMWMTESPIMSTLETSVPTSQPGINAIRDSPSGSSKHPIMVSIFVTAMAVSVLTFLYTGTLY